jgi:hypothetical protein
MAEFKSVLRLQKVSPEGKVLQEEEIDLRRGIFGKGDPTEETEGTAGISYYDISDIENGNVVEWVCVSDSGGRYIWMTKKGTPGKDGKSVTIARVTESDEDGGTNVVVFSNGEELSIKNGKRGKTGKGLDIKGTYDTLEALDTAVTAPVQGDMYNVGTEAPYTIYMYDTEHGWVSQGQLQGANGITFTPAVDADGNLSWTNDGGLPNPPSANIKGKNGTSVTVTSVSESEEDGGSNVVTFSDGMKLTVKNGSNGHTPVKGVDYFTDAEKAEMVSEAAAAIPIGDYVQKSGATMTGALVAHANTNYTIPQVRNVIYVEEGASVPPTQDCDLVLFRK